MHLVACVGSDDDGRALIRELGDEGVDTRYVFEVDAPTGLAMIEVAADGENTIVVVPGANHAWRPELVDSVPLRPGDLVVCQLEIPLEIVADVAEPRTGIRIALHRQCGPDTIRGSQRSRHSRRS